MGTRLVVLDEEGYEFATSFHVLDFATPLGPFESHALPGGSWAIAGSAGHAAFLMRSPDAVFVHAFAGTSATISLSTPGRAMTRVGGQVYVATDAEIVEVTLATREVRILPVDGCDAEDIAPIGASRLGVACRDAPFAIVDRATGAVTSSSSASVVAISGDPETDFALVTTAGVNGEHTGTFDPATGLAGGVSGRLRGEAVFLSPERAAAVSGNHLVWFDPVETKAVEYLSDAPFALATSPDRPVLFARTDYSYCVQLQRFSTWGVETGTFLLGPPPGLPDSPACRAP